MGNVAFDVICPRASSQYVTPLNDAKTFLKHFSDCLFYFCSTCADSITASNVAAVESPQK